MSEEPNRKMDDLLKAYAKKRQAEIGTPEMHPATRNLLHGEVRRTLGHSSVKETGTSFWSLIWPKFALVTAACIVVAAGIVMTAKKPETELEMAQASAKVSALEDKLGTPRASEADSALREESPRDEVAAVQAVPSHAPVAPPQIKQPDVAGYAAVAERALAKEERPSKQLSTYKAAGSVPSASPPAAAASAAPATEQLRFKKVTAETAARVASPAPAQTPLADFRMETLGDRIRIIDADGSVYEGRLLAAAESGDKRRSRKAEAESVGKDAAGKFDAMRPEFRFQVAGTNRTLNKPVRFEGVASTIVAQTRAPEEFKEADVARSDSFVPSQIQNIQGTLFLDATNKVPVDAVRAP